MLHLNFQIVIDARDNFQPLVADDAKLPLLRASQHVLQLIEHWSNRFLANFNREAPLPLSRNIDLRPQRGDGGEWQLAISRK